MGIEFGDEYAPYKLLDYQAQPWEFEDDLVGDFEENCLGDEANFGDYLASFPYLRDAFVEVRAGEDALITPASCDEFIETIREYFQLSEEFLRSELYTLHNTFRSQSGVFNADGAALWTKDPSEVPAAEELAARPKIPPKRYALAQIEERFLPHKILEALAISEAAYAEVAATEATDNPYVLTDEELAAEKTCEQFVQTYLFLDVMQDNTFVFKAYVESFPYLKAAFYPDGEEGDMLIPTTVEDFREILADHYLDEQRLELQYRFLRGEELEAEELLDMETPSELDFHTSVVRETETHVAATNQEAFDEVKKMALEIYGAGNTHLDNLVDGKNSYGHSNLIVSLFEIYVIGASANQWPYDQRNASHGEHLVDAVLAHYGNVQTGMRFANSAMLVSATMTQRFRELYNRLDDETKSAIRAAIREKYHIPADQALTYDVLQQIGNDLNLVHEPFLMEEIGGVKFLYHPGVDQNKDGVVNLDDRYEVSVNGYLKGIENGDFFQSEILPFFQNAKTIVHDQYDAIAEMQDPEDIYDILAAFPTAEAKEKIYTEVLGIPESLVLAAEEGDEARPLGWSDRDWEFAQLVAESKGSYQTAETLRMVRNIGLMIGGAALAAGTVHLTAGGSMAAYGSVLAVALACAGGGAGWYLDHSHEAHLRDIAHANLLSDLKNEGFGSEAYVELMRDRVACSDIVGVTGIATGSMSSLAVLAPETVFMKVLGWETLKGTMEGLVLGTVDGRVTGIDMNRWQQALETGQPGTYGVTDAVIGVVFVGAISAGVGAGATGGMHGLGRMVVHFNTKKTVVSLQAAGVPIGRENGRIYVDTPEGRLPVKNLVHDKEQGAVLVELEDGRTLVMSDRGATQESEVYLDIPDEGRVKVKSVVEDQEAGTTVVTLIDGRVFTFKPTGETGVVRARAGDEEDPLVTVRVLGDGDDSGEPLPKILGDDEAGPPIINLDADDAVDPAVATVPPRSRPPVARRGGVVPPEGAEDVLYSEANLGDRADPLRRGGVVPPEGAVLGRGNRAPTWTRVTRVTEPQAFEDVISQIPDVVVLRRNSSRLDRWLSNSNLRDVRIQFVDGDDITYNPANRTITMGRNHPDLNTPEKLLPRLVHEITHADDMYANGLRLWGSEHGDAPMPRELFVDLSVRAERNALIEELCIVAELQQQGLHPGMEIEIDGQRMTAQDVYKAYGADPDGFLAKLYDYLNNPTVRIARWGDQAVSYPEYYGRLYDDAVGADPEGAGPSVRPQGEGTAYPGWKDWLSRRRPPADGTTPKPPDDGVVPGPRVEPEPPPPGGGIRLPKPSAQPLPVAPPDTHAIPTRVEFVDPATNTINSAVDLTSNQDVPFGFAPGTTERTSANLIFADPNNPSALGEVLGFARYNSTNRSWSISYTGDASLNPRMVGADGSARNIRAGAQISCSMWTEGEVSSSLVLGPNVGAPLAAPNQGIRLSGGSRQATSTDWANNVPHLVSRARQRGVGAKPGLHVEDAVVIAGQAPRGQAIVVDGEHGEFSARWKGSEVAGVSDTAQPKGVIALQDADGHIIFLDNYHNPPRRSTEKEAVPPGWVKYQDVAGNYFLGKVSYNEDGCALIRVPKGDVPGGEVLYVLSVDGMGGHGDGDHAKTIAIRAITEALAQGDTPPEAIRAALLALQLDGMDPTSRVATVFQAALARGKNVQDALTEAFRADSTAFQGAINDSAGVCLTLAQLTPTATHGMALSTYTVGDARTMVFGPTGEVYRTRDNSLVMTLWEKGSLASETQARTHPQNNIVSGPLMRSGDEVDIREGGVNVANRVGEGFEAIPNGGDLPPGAWVVSASDGLWDKFDGAEIYNMIKDCRTAAEARDVLYRAAMADRAAHPDNLNIVVTRVGDAPTLAAEAGTVGLHIVEVVPDPRPKVAAVVASAPPPPPPPPPRSRTGLGGPRTLAPTLTYDRVNDGSISWLVPSPRNRAAPATCSLSANGTSVGSWTNTHQVVVRANGQDAAVIYYNANERAWFVMRPTHHLVMVGGAAIPTGTDGTGVRLAGVGETVQFTIAGTAHTFTSTLPSGLADAAHVPAFRRSVEAMTGLSSGTPEQAIDPQALRVNHDLLTDQGETGDMTATADQRAAIQSGQDPYYEAYNHIDPSATRMLPVARDAQQSVAQRIGMRPSGYWSWGGATPISFEDGSYASWMVYPPTGAAYERAGTPVSRGGPLGRFYLSVRGSQSNDVQMALMTVYAEARRQGINFGFKMPSDPNDFGRADACVVYFENGNEEWMWRQLVALVEQNPIYFREDGRIPQFASRVLNAEGRPVPNLGFAMDPSGSSSYGGMIAAASEEAIGVLTRLADTGQIITRQMYYDEVAYQLARRGIDVSNTGFMANADGASGQTIFPFLFTHTVLNDPSVSVVAEPVPPVRPSGDPTRPAFVPPPEELGSPPPPRLGPPPPQGTPIARAAAQLKSADAATQLAGLEAFGKLSRAGKASIVWDVAALVANAENAPHVRAEAIRALTSLPEGQRARHSPTVRYRVLIGEDEIQVAARAFYEALTPAELTACADDLLNLLRSTNVDVRIWVLGLLNTLPVEARAAHAEAVRPHLIDINETVAARARTFLGIETRPTGEEPPPPAPPPLREGGEIGSPLRAPEPLVGAVPTGEGVRPHGARSTGSLAGEMDQIILGLTSRDRTRQLAAITGLTGQMEGLPEANRIRIFNAMFERAWDADEEVRSAAITFLARHFDSVPEALRGRALGAFMAAAQESTDQVCMPAAAFLTRHFAFASATEQENITMTFLTVLTSGRTTQLRQNAARFFRENILNIPENLLGRVTAVLSTRRNVETAPQVLDDISAALGALEQRRASLATAGYSGEPPIARAVARATRAQLSPLLDDIAAGDLVLSVTPPEPRPTGPEPVGASPPVPSRPVPTGLSRIRAGADPVSMGRSVDLRNGHVKNKPLVASLAWNETRGCWQVEAFAGEPPVVVRINGEVVPPGQIWYFEWDGRAGLDFGFDGSPTARFVPTYREEAPPVRRVDDVGAIPRGRPEPVGVDPEGAGPSVRPDEGQAQGPAPTRGEPPAPVARVVGSNIAAPGLPPAYMLGEGVMRIGHGGSGEEFVALPELPPTVLPDEVEIRVGGDHPGLGIAHPRGTTIVQTTRFHSISIGSGRYYLSNGEILQIGDVAYWVGTTADGTRALELAVRGRHGYEDPRTVVVPPVRPLPTSSVGADLPPVYNLGDFGVDCPVGYGVRGNYGINLPELNAVDGVNGTGLVFERRGQNYSVLSDGSFPVYVNGQPVQQSYSPHVTGPSYVSPQTLCGPSDAPVLIEIGDGAASVAYWFGFLSGQSTPSLEVAVRNADHTGYLQPRSLQRPNAAEGPPVPPPRDPDGPPEGPPVGPPPRVGPVGGEPPRRRTTGFTVQTGRREARLVEFGGGGTSHALRARDGTRVVIRYDATTDTWLVNFPSQGNIGTPVRVNGHVLQAGRSVAIFEGDNPSCAIKIGDTTHTLRPTYVEEPIQPPSDVGAIPSDRQEIVFADPPDLDGAGPRVGPDEPVGADLSVRPGQAQRPAPTGPRISHSDHPHGELTATNNQGLPAESINLTGRNYFTIGQNGDVHGPYTGEGYPGAMANVFWDEDAGAWMIANTMDRSLWIRNPDAPDTWVEVAAGQTHAFARSGEGAPRAGSGQEVIGEIGVDYKNLELRFAPRVRPSLPAPTQYPTHVILRTPHGDLSLPIYEDQQVVYLNVYPDGRLSLSYDYTYNTMGRLFWWDDEQWRFEPAFGSTVEVEGAPFPDTSLYTLTPGTTRLRVNGDDLTFDAAFDDDWNLNLGAFEDGGFTSPALREVSVSRTPLAGGGLATPTGLYDLVPYGYNYVGSRATRGGIALPELAFANVPDEVALVLGSNYHFECPYVYHTGDTTSVRVNGRDVGLNESADLSMPGGNPDLIEIAGVAYWFGYRADGTPSLEVTQPRWLGGDFEPPHTLVNPADTSSVVSVPLRGTPVAGFPASSPSVAAIGHPPAYALQAGGYNDMGQGGHVDATNLSLPELNWTGARADEVAVSLQDASTPSLRHNEHDRVPVRVNGREVGPGDLAPLSSPGQEPNLVEIGGVAYWFGYNGTASDATPLLEVAVARAAGGYEAPQTVVHPYPARAALIGVPTEGVYVIPPGPPIRAGRGGVLDLVDVTDPAIGPDAITFHNFEGECWFEAGEGVVRGISFPAPDNSSGTPQFREGGDYVSSAAHGRDGLPARDELPVLVTIGDLHDGGQVYWFGYNARGEPVLELAVVGNRSWLGTTYNPPRQVVFPTGQSRAYRETMAHLADVRGGENFNGRSIGSLEALSAAERTSLADTVVGLLRESTVTKYSRREIIDFLPRIISSLPETRRGPYVTALASYLDQPAYTRTVLGALSQAVGYLPVGERTLYATRIASYLTAPDQDIRTAASRTLAELVPQLPITERAGFVRQLVPFYDDLDVSRMMPYLPINERSAIVARLYPLDAVASWNVRDLPDFVDHLPLDQRLPYAEALITFVEAQLNPTGFARLNLLRRTPDVSDHIAALGRLLGVLRIGDRSPVIDCLHGLALGGNADAIYALNVNRFSLPQEMQNNPNFVTLIGELVRVSDIRSGDPHPPMDAYAPQDPTSVDPPVIRMDVPISPLPGERGGGEGRPTLGRPPTLGGGPTLGGPTLGGRTPPPTGVTTSLGTTGVAAPVAGAASSAPTLGRSRLGSGLTALGAAASSAPPYTTAYARLGQLSFVPPSGRAPEMVMTPAMMARFGAPGIPWGYRVTGPDGTQVLEQAGLHVVVTRNDAGNIPMTQIYFDAEGACWMVNVIGDGVTIDGHAQVRGNVVPVISGRASIQVGGQTFGFISLQAQGATVAPPPPVGAPVVAPVVVPVVPMGAPSLSPPPPLPPGGQGIPVPGVVVRPPVPPPVGAPVTAPITTYPIPGVPVGAGFPRPVGAPLVRISPSPSPPPLEGGGIRGEPTLGGVTPRGVAAPVTAPVTIIGHPAGIYVVPRVPRPGQTGGARVDLPLSGNQIIISNAQIPELGNARLVLTYDQGSKIWYVEGSANLPEELVVVSDDPLYAGETQIARTVNDAPTVLTVGGRDYELGDLGVRPATPGSGGSTLGSSGLGGGLTGAPSGAPRLGGPTLGGPTLGGGLVGAQFIAPAVGVVAPTGPRAARIPANDPSWTTGPWNPTSMVTSVGPVDYSTPRVPRQKTGFAGLFARDTRPDDVALYYGEQGVSPLDGRSRGLTANHVVGTVDQATYIVQQSAGPCQFIAVANSMTMAARRQGLQIGQATLTRLTQAAYDAFRAHVAAHPELHPQVGDVNNPFASADEVAQMFNQVFAQNGINLRLGHQSTRAAPYRIVAGDQSTPATYGRYNQLGLPQNLEADYRAGDVFTTTSFYGEFLGAVDNHAMSVMDINLANNDVTLYDQASGLVYNYQIPQLYQLASEQSGGRMDVVYWEFTDASGTPVVLTEALHRMDGHIP